MCLADCDRLALVVASDEENYFALWFAGSLVVYSDTHYSALAPRYSFAEPELVSNGNCKNTDWVQP